MFNIFNYVQETGTITVDASQVEASVVNIFTGIFGSNLNTDASTPQGMLIQAFTLMFIGLAENNASLANQINRNIAGGLYLDADAALFGISRMAGYPSTVYATITGVAGTVIASNSQASETVNGALFATVSTVTIPAEGTLANVQFKAWINAGNDTGFVNGPIPCAANTLTQIVSNITGWETVTNPVAAIPGVLQQSDVNFNNTINSTLGAQSIYSLDSVTAAIYQTPGVTSAYPLENDEDTTETIQGVSMVPHSIYYCISGTASNEDIANSFSASKAPGCSYNWGPGINQSYTFLAPISSQEIVIMWDSPSMINVQIQVTIRALTSLQDPTTSIQAAVLAYANGEVPFMPGFTVGTNVSPSQIAAAISQQIPGIFVEEVQVGVISFTKQGTLEISSNAITSMPSIAGITNGMTVTGTGIPSMTTVTNAALSANSIQISNNATLSGVQVLTFTESVSFGTAPISISAWQQGATIAAYITVIEA